MAETDVLDRLLGVAHAEGALDPERQTAFAEGLRERARLVLKERVGPLDLKIQALERAVAALQQETAWRRDSMKALETEVSSLKGEAVALRVARDQASAAHDRLLAHHREVVSRAALSFSAAASLPFWKFRECRAQLAEAAAVFEREGM